MSKGSNTTTQTQNTSGSVAPNPQAFQAYQDLLARAGTVSNTPFAPFQGQEVAGISDTSQGAIDQSKGWASGFAPFNPAGIINDAGQWVTGSDIGKYMDPYTQQVIDATQRDFDVQNQRAASATAGNAASIGALGGNSTAVAKALTQEGQERVQAPIIAGLRSQGFQSAEQMANAQKARELTSGQALSQGEQASIGTQAALGTQEQQTQQAQFTQQMTDYYQQQGYPFATAQWLAAITLGTGPQMGSTSTGTGVQTTQGPQPNQFLQGAGLGLTALAAFSDERLKEDVKEIGRLHDGQKIYRFRYKGDPQVHVGMLSQEVEKHHPEAVHNISGFGAVDYDRATEDAVKRWSGGSVRGFAPGGAPQLGATPYGAAGAGWVPTISLPSATPMQATLPRFSDPKVGDPNKDAMGQISKGLGSLKGLGSGLSEGFGKIGSGISDFLGMGSGAGTAFDPSGYGFYPSGADGLSGMASEGGSLFAYNTGGSVPVSSGFAGGIELPRRRGLATGGIPSDDDYEQVDATDLPPITYNPSAPKDASEAIASKLIKNDPVGPGDAPPPSSAYASEDPNDERPAATSVRYAQVRQPGVAGAAPTATDASPAMPGGSASPVEPQSSGFGFRMSDEARQGLISMGLAMMGNRVGGKGSFLAGIGDAGAQGMNTYGQARNATLAQEMLKRKEALETLKQQQLEQHRRAIEDNQRQTLNRPPPGYTRNPDGTMSAIKGGPADPDVKSALTKPPAGYARNPDGTMSVIKGGPADPEVMAAVAKVKRGAPMDDNTADFLAERVISGDLKALVGLGRGAQGAENILRVQGLVAQKAAERGLNANDLLARVAEQSGLTASQRTFGTQIARMAVNATEAQGAIQQGLEVSKNVKRGNWVPLNKLLQMKDENISDPDLLEFKAANLAIINTYARAINPTGIPHESDKAHAHKLITEATSEEAYERVLRRMDKEIEIAHSAPSIAKKELERIRKSGSATDAPKEPTKPTTAPMMSDDDKRALDWANANPDNPDAVAIKKSLAARGVQ